MKNLLLVYSFYLMVCPSDFYAQNALELLGHLPFDSASLAGCWHYVHPDGTEYALVGTSQGLSIVDLENPKQPKEIFKIASLPNNWREVKTWQGYAYFGSEAVGSGITIVDLTQLPEKVSHKIWTGDGLHEGKITTAHTVQCEDGYLYIFGGSMLTNGAIICELSDPWNPVVVGTYTDNYLHDGCIRGDTLWGSEIYQGQFSVIDISDKSHPKLLQTQPTPGRFNHNSWLSDDGKYLFTTDERPDAPMTAFDVSKLEDIQLLDVYFPSGNPSREVHNVRGLGNFLVNPSYGGQLTIVDATFPDNLIEVGFASLGQSLVWDADPYLPSGIIFASAKNEGFFVFKPTYQQAAYLEGNISDAITGLPIGNALVTIEEMPKRELSKNSGYYKTGASQAGFYQVRVEKIGYEPVTIPKVALQTGKIALLDVALQPAFSASAKGVPSLPIITLTPTLVEHQLSVEIPADDPFFSQNSKIQIANLHGQTFLETPLTGTRTQLNQLAHLPAGSYILYVKNENGQSVVRRFLKS